MTRRLCWEDDHCYHAEARIVAVIGNEIACDQTFFYPAGGGQPPDQGSLATANDQLSATSVRADLSGVVWHQTDRGVGANAVGRIAKLAIDVGRRVALARYHTVLHILNTLDHRCSDYCRLLAHRLQPARLLASDARRN